MPGYTKLFSSIVTSTIWCEDHPTRIVWIAMLAMKNWDGVVEGSVPGFAHLARVTVPEMEKALSVLLAEDPHSRTSDNGGRRIETVPGGWRVLNHETYNFKESEDHKREMAAERSRRYRGRHAVTRDVTPSRVTSPYTDLNRDRDTEKREPDSKERGGPTLPPPFLGEGQTKSPPGSDAETGKEVTPTPPQSTPRPLKGGSLPGVDAGVGVGHPEIERKAGSGRSGVFVKPTAAEVTTYAAGIGFQLDGEAFVAFYESKGWLVGRTPMRNWRAAVVTWKKRNGGHGHGKTAGAGFRNSGEDHAGAVVL